jgi:hypothetical protein
MKVGTLDEMRGFVWYDHGSRFGRLFTVPVRICKHYPDDSLGLRRPLDGVEVSSCPGQHENIVPFPQDAGSHCYIFAAAIGLLPATGILP